jgi:hypothetical protein
VNRVISFKRDLPNLCEFHAMLPNEESAIQYMQEHLIPETVNSKCTEIDAYSGRSPKDREAVYWNLLFITLVVSVARNIL